jgi:uncharacterized protein
MPVTVVCPACKSKLKAPDNLIGKAVKCPSCSKPVLVKAAAAPASAPAPAPKKPPVKPAPVIEEEPIEEMEPVEDEVESPKPKKKKRPAEANGDEAGAPGLGGPTTDKERSTALWIYLLPCLLSCCMGIGSFISLFLWISKRKESAFIDYHGKNWLNLMINSMALSMVLSVFIGVGGFLPGWAGSVISGLFGLLMLAVGFYFLVAMIVSGFKAKGGEWYQPMMAFRVLK